MRRYTIPISASSAFPVLLTSEVRLDSSSHESTLIFVLVLKNISSTQDLLHLTGQLAIPPEFVGSGVTSFAYENFRESKFQVSIEGALISFKYRKLSSKSEAGVKLVVKVRERHSLIWMHFLMM